MKIKKILNTNKKKGLSSIIASLMIILLSLAALGIVWQIVEKLTKPELILSPKSCLDMQLSPPYTLDRVCYNSTTKELIVSIEKKYEYNIESLYLIVNEQNSQSSKWCCGKQCPNCILPLSILSQKDLFMPIDLKPDKISLEINDCILETKDVIDC